MAHARSTTVRFRFRLDKTRWNIWISPKQLVREIKASGSWIATWKIILVLMRQAGALDNIWSKPMIVRSRKALERALRSNELRVKIATVQQPFEGGYGLTKLSQKENGLVAIGWRHPQ